MLCTLLGGQARIVVALHAQLDHARMSSGEEARFGVGLGRLGEFKEKPQRRGERLIKLIRLPMPQP